MRYSILIALTLMVLLGATPAYGQSKKELAAQNAALAQRLTVLENRMLTGDPAAERLMQRMDALEGSQRSLTGEVEQLRYERDSLQEEVRLLAAEVASLHETAEKVKTHLKAVSTVASQPAPSGSVSYGGGRVGGGVYQGGSSLPPPPTISNSTKNTSDMINSGNDVSKLAEIGKQKMLEGDFAAAQTAFKQYLQHNAGADDEGEMHFWLGETYYVKGGYSDAADSYIASMRLAPKGDHAPEAMIKLAATARALDKKDMACQTLASFPSQYPNASPSVLEKARQERTRSGC